jgi:ABC-2 type transport system ATP-binding protein
METALKITHLSKSFGKKKIIDDISLDVYAGEVFGFLGPNGAGKTTTIKMVMGFLTPDEGSITINGFDRDKNYEKAMACLGGIVENPEMYKDLSGRVNLEMYARLHTGVDSKRIAEAAELVGMQDRINEKVKKYSLGMKQRVGLAQAILHKPRVLILDEPTNGLDPAGIRELRDILKKLAHEENVAVMVSSHLLTEMQMMCDRVGIIHKGKLIEVKTLEDLTKLSSGAVIYRIMTPQKDTAVSLINKAFEKNLSGTGTDYLDLEVDTDQLQRIIRLLSMNEVPILGVNKLESSLEDAFIKLTGGGIIIE